MEDNRKYERYQQHGLIDLVVGNGSKPGSVFGQHEKVVGFINDISRSGIGGRTLNPLNEGERVVVKRVTLHDCNIKCDIPATVLWTKKVGNKQRFGISLEKEIPGERQQ